MLQATTSGSPYERGYQYGQQLGEPVRRRAARPTGGGPAGPGPAKGEWPGGAGSAEAEVAGRMLGYLERHEPALVDEMRGLAAGADVPFGAVFRRSSSTSSSTFFLNRPITSSRSAVSCSRAACPASCASGGVHDNDVLINFPSVPAMRVLVTA